MSEPVLIEKHWDVYERLKELELTAEGLREAVLAGVLESRACTEYDPVSARGYELWRMASRRLREVFIVGPSPKWRPVDEQGQPLIVNPLLRTAVTVSSGDEFTGIGDSSRPPKTRNPKGQVTADLVEANVQFILFPQEPQAVRSPSRHERKTYILLVWAAGAEARLELSVPRSIENGFIVDWHERIILEPIDLDPPLTQGWGSPEGGDSEIEVTVTRKLGA